MVSESGLSNVSFTATLLAELPGLEGTIRSSQDSSSSLGHFQGIEQSTRVVEGWVDPLPESVIMRSRNVGSLLCGKQSELVSAKVVELSIWEGSHAQRFDEDPVVKSYRDG
ncbi:hypothetical protein IFM46972_10122 [Aspergillus udagawae]|uniref:Uncharacterized protein n=1 Tax=Aspergillus udagawae TaxID=91492 RepID=A0A8H3SAK9_9EURO|nr:hypothetical protein IFM46972_10122 [Aspergillus udagawae]